MEFVGNLGVDRWDNFARSDHSTALLVRLCGLPEYNSDCSQAPLVAIQVVIPTTAAADIHDAAVADMQPYTRHLQTLIPLEVLVQPP